MSYDAALFVDNDAAHIARVRGCPRIATLHVGGFDGEPPPVPFGDPRYANLLQRMSPAACAWAALVRALDPAGAEPLDLESGISTAHAAEMVSWARARRAAAPHARLAALVDFDRTLTHFEGIVSVSAVRDGWEAMLAHLRSAVPALAAALTLEGFVEYYVGGTERLKELQALMRALRGERVHLILLTNNAVCDTDPRLLLDFASVLCPPRMALDVICSRGHGSDKRAALLADARTRALCEDSAAQLGIHASRPPSVRRILRGGRASPPPRSPRRRRGGAPMPPA